MDKIGSGFFSFIYSARILQTYIYHYINLIIVNWHHIHMFTIEKCWHIFCVCLSTHCWMNRSSDSHIILNSITETECSTDIGILCVCVFCVCSLTGSINLQTNIWRCNSIWSNELTVILKRFFQNHSSVKSYFFTLKFNFEYLLKLIWKWSLNV